MHAFPKAGNRSVPFPMGLYLIQDDHIFAKMASPWKRDTRETNEIDRSLEGTHIEPTPEPRKYSLTPLSSEAKDFIKTTDRDDR